MRTLPARWRADLPALTDDEHFVAFNVTVSGGVVAVSEELGRRNRLGDRRGRGHRHEAGRGWSSVPLTGVTLAPSRVDRLPDGEFLLVQSRTGKRPYGPTRDSAQVFDPSGRPLRSFRLGDGVDQLAVDEPGTIWAG